MKNRRKRIMIDWSLQSRMVGIMALGSFSVSLITVLGMQRLYDEVLLTLEDSDVPHELIVLVISKFTQYTYSMITLIIFSLLLAWVLAFYLSSWVAGPITKVNSTLDQIIAGEKVSPILIRKRDFFSGLVDRVNALTTLRGETFEEKPE